MINDKLDLTYKILHNFPETRGDGHGKFLNRVRDILFSNKEVDFEMFNVETYTRARRKILELHPELDNRTIRTSRAVNQVISEVV